MFKQKKKLAADVNGEGDAPANPEPKFGGSILITHTHWDHIQGACFRAPNPLR
jgi:ribonuclease BN (tRNA processing enzyme)